jgi:hypothetical protein
MMCESRSEAKGKFEPLKSFSFTKQPESFQHLEEITVTSPGVMSSKISE